MSYYPLVAGVVAVVIVFAWSSITYVYRDAPRRGMDEDQWAGVLALSFGFGILVYLLKRPPIEDVDGEPGEPTAVQE